MSNYKVEIVSASRELSKRERVKIKDTGNAIRLDELVSIDEPYYLTPTMWAELRIYNPASENIEYNVYIIIDDDGHKYITGSTSFWTSFQLIWEEMDGEEEYEIEVYKTPSKRYNDKYFLNCSLR